MPPSSAADRQVPPPPVCWRGQGRSTVLFEREAGPRHKVCGEFISVEAAAHLTSLGLAPERLGAVPIHHVRLIQGERTATATLPFPAFSLSRDVMDEALLNAAAGQGRGDPPGLHHTRPDRGRRRRHPPGRRTCPRPHRLPRHRKARTARPPPPARCDQRPHRLQAPPDPCPRPGRDPRGPCGSAAVPRRLRRPSADPRRTRQPVPRHRKRRP